MMDPRIEQVLELLRSRDHRVSGYPRLNEDLDRLRQRLAAIESRSDVERWWQDPDVHLHEIGQALERLMSTDRSSLDRLLFTARGTGALPATTATSQDTGPTTVHVGQNQGGLVAGRDVQVSGLNLQNSFAGLTSDTPSRESPTPQEARPHQDEEEALRVLFLAANPDDSTRLRLDQEVRAIDRSLRLAKLDTRVRLEQQWAVQVGDLQDSLLRHRPIVVHFSGHGAAEGLLLEDASGRGHQVHGRHLERLFGMFREHLRCVVLNCCHSADQALAIAEVIDCVIGMTTTLGDQAAIHFAVGFYRALAASRSVQAAFEHACLEVDLFKPSEGEIPKLTCLRNDPANLFLLPARPGER